MASEDRARRLALQDNARDKIREMLAADQSRGPICEVLQGRFGYSRHYALQLIRSVRRELVAEHHGVMLDDPASVRLDGLVRWAERRSELEKLRGQYMERCADAGELPDLNKLSKLDKAIDEYTEKLGRWAWVHKIEPDRGLHDGDVRATVLAAVIENLGHFPPLELRRLADALAVVLGPEDEADAGAADDLDDVLPR